jgi:putative protease
MKPELLAPGGNLEKSKIALLYGADAVYLSGQKFGLRVASGNLSSSELIDILAFAHALKKKVYLTLNGFLHQHDLEELPDFLAFLQDHHTDAVIVSDLGVVETVRHYSTLPIHLSTQASVVNTFAARFWKSLGVQRIIVGRELSIEEAGEIAQNAQIEIEMFVHGALCMSYSGHCVISNYTAGRDSNRGGCKQSCRFTYRLSPVSPTSEKALETSFMSSKDLNGISLLPQFIQHQIQSLKIEGRMKSNLYVASLVKTYRQALDWLEHGGSWDFENRQAFYQKTQEVSHREYTEASLLQKAGADSVLACSEESSRYVMLGTVIDIQGSWGFAFLRHAIDLENTLEILPFVGSALAFPAKLLTTLQNRSLRRFQPNTLVRFPAFPGVEVFNLLRLASPLSLQVSIS